jgi:hypothetical protein
MAMPEDVGDIFQRVAFGNIEFLYFTLDADPFLGSRIWAMVSLRGRSHVKFCNCYACTESRVD